MSDVIRIELEHEDGMIESASGDDARQIWATIEGGFTMQHIHGNGYSGPKLKVIRPAGELERKQ